MSLSKRISISILTALVALLAGVFLFDHKVYAQETTVLDGLRQNEPVIEQSSQMVSDKTNELRKTSQEVQSIEDKKQVLEQEVSDLKQQLEQMKQKIADKKAEAEAERIRLDDEANSIRLEKIRVAKFKTYPVQSRVYGSNSAGNTYDAGYCTWYVKNKRSDLPNSLGNANTWSYRAQVLGMSVGSTPKKGAIGATTAGSLGHVVYVESVSADGQTVTVSEMNYQGFYVISQRTVHYSEFSYIY